MPQSIVSESLVRVFGAILGVLIVFALGLTFYSKYVKKREYPERKPLPCGLTKPMLALELVRSAKEVEMVLGKDTDESNTVMREMLKDDLKGDSYAFIPTYWLLFVAMSWLLANRHWDWATWMGIAAGACITAAAVFDYLENSRISAVLETSISNTKDEMALAISSASLIKWGLIFMATAILSALFWRHNWVGLIAILYLLSAVIGFVGFIHRPAIEWASYVLVIAIILAAVVFTVFPQKFLNDF